MTKNSVPFENILLPMIAALGIYSFGIWLAYFRVADYDIWARFAQGASIWNTGHLMHKDMFAFTPVLADNLDHEWGAGLVFFSFLKLFGPSSLIFLKAALGVGALFFALLAGRVNGAKWPALFVIAIPAFLAIFPAYLPVIRSHVFTYLFFSITLFCLEMMRKDVEWWPGLIIITVMAMWANLHGGYISGLGMVIIYTLGAIFRRRAAPAMLATLAASFLVTLINPYGIKLWASVIRAVLIPRPDVGEWYPMSILAFDIFIGFRITLAIALAAAAIGWRDLKKRLPEGAAILIITAWFTLRHKRHAAFFGLAAAVFLGPYLESAAARIKTYIPYVMRKGIRPALVIFLVYVLIAGSISLYLVPNLSDRILLHAGLFPVRATEILKYSKQCGNVALPFGWGNYVMWRLYPNIKISACGRYESIYPKSTLDMNDNFFKKSGKDWGRLVTRYKVDFIMIDFTNTRLAPSDMNDLGFELVWADGYSALFARKDITPLLRSVDKNLPNPTPEVFDAGIPDGWWPV